MTLPTVILVPMDFSPCANLAFQHAVELASKLGAKVHLLNVVDLQGFGIDYGIVVAEEVLASVCETNRRELEKLISDRGKEAAFGPPLVEIGEPRITIPDYAAALHADLIVMGTHGRRGLKRFLLGSVAESVTRNAPCPVLLVREKSTHEKTRENTIAPDDRLQPAPSS
jgi:nucleotide-binding universal stress UspA family protein